MTSLLYTVLHSESRRTNKEYCADIVYRVCYTYIYVYGWYNACTLKPSRVPAKWHDRDGYTQILT